MTISQSVQSSTPVLGLRLITAPTGVADVVTISGSFLGGSSFAPQDNPIVPHMVVGMLDEGTQKRSKLEIHTALESAGVSLRFSCYNQYIGFTIHALKSCVPLALDLLVEQLREPAFNPEDFATEKKRAIANLLQLKEDTGALSSIKLSQALYPKDHPNYDEDPDVTVGYVEKMTTDDLQQYHESAFGLGTMTIAAAGDVDHEELEKLLAAVFRGWKQSPIIQAQHSYKANSIHKGMTLYLPVFDKTSVDVNFGLPLHIDRNHPDFYPFFIGNYIFGSGSVGWLYKNVREKLGLTYAIYSGIGGVREGDDGYWFIHGSFAPPLLRKGIEATRKEIERFAQKGVTAKELSSKQETIANRFLIGLATSEGMARTLLNVIEQGRPKEFLDEYPNLIRGLKLKKVNDAIKKYVDPEKIVTIAAGSIDAKGNPLEK